MAARYTVTLACVLLITACAGPGTREPVSRGWSQHRAILGTLDHWTTSGKLALRTADRSESANLVWEQRARDSYLNLSGLMGLNAATVHSDGRNMEVIQGEERRSFDISTPDAVHHNTGWEFPMSALPYWLRGLPAPELKVQSLQLDSARALLWKLEQDDWQVLYEDYEEFHGYTLPTRLRIKRGDTAVKIILRDWQTGDH